MTIASHLPYLIHLSKSDTFINTSIARTHIFNLKTVRKNPGRGEMSGRAEIIILISHLQQREVDLLTIVYWQMRWGHTEITQT